MTRGPASSARAGRRWAPLHALLPGLAAALGPLLSLWMLALLDGDPDATQDAPAPADDAPITVDAPPPPEQPTRDPSPSTALDALAPAPEGASAPAASEAPLQPPPLAGAQLGAVSAGPAGGGLALPRGRFDAPSLGSGSAGAGGRGVEQAAGATRKARALFRPAPRYPPEARRKGLEGEVIVRMRVGADGRVREVVVVRSSPPGVFDEVARRAAMNYRFEPATRGGGPTESTVEQRIAFKLR